MSSWIAHCYRHFAPQLPVWTWPILLWSLWRVGRWLQREMARQPGLRFSLHCTRWGEVWAKTYRCADTLADRDTPYANDADWYPGAPANHFLRWKGMGLCNRAQVAASPLVADAGGSTLARAASNASSTDDRPRKSVFGQGQGTPRRGGLAWPVTGPQPPPA
ncbi:MAG: hypothetical protein AAFR41_09810 [Pseudomonadota bacterium]